MYGGMEKTVIGSKTSSASGKTAILTGWLVTIGRRLTRAIILNNEQNNKNIHQPEILDTVGLFYIETSPDMRGSGPSGFNS